jgi:hypothetical protein
MAITQRFYPKFFQAALNGAPDLFDTDTLYGQIILMQQGATFDIGQINFADISSFEIANTIQPIEVQLQIDPITEKMNFIVPSVTWTVAPAEPFHHAVITDGKAELLFMHFDFDGAQSPAGEFTLTPSTCIPHINFAYQTCLP